MTKGYGEYCRALGILEKGEAPLPSDRKLLERTCDRLHDDCIGAGSNTWQKAMHRHRKAAARLRQLKDDQLI